MLAPRRQARMLQEINDAQARAGARVGASSGYMAALLAHRAQLRDSRWRSCPSWPSWPPPTSSAPRCSNAAVRQGDWLAQPAGRASVRRHRAVRARWPRCRRGLLGQLKVGGRLIAIVGQQPMMRCTLVTRSGEHAYASVDLFDTVAAASCGASTRPSEVPVLIRSPRGPAKDTAMPASRRHRLRAAAPPPSRWPRRFGGSAGRRACRRSTEAARGYDASFLARAPARFGAVPRRAGQS